jgi:predicted transcriptional regulator
MAQVTIYLDEQTEQRMKRAAEEAGVSRSRWIADVIREKTAAEWPQAVRRLAGAWRDFPEVEELRSGLGEDAPREPL